MIVGQAVGGHEARHVAVPARDARLVGGEAEGVEVACREGEEGGLVLSFGAEFRLSRQQVVAQVVTCLRESGQLEVEVGRRVVFRVVGFRLPGGRPCGGFRSRFGDCCFSDMTGHASGNFQTSGFSF